MGKAPGRVEMSQADINALLVERGKEGVCVVRLKGGDPFVFARGGEEAAALLDAGVPFEVVPGITSAIAVPAYAGIPLTLRHSSTSFTVVTGHEDPSVGEHGHASTGTRSVGSAARSSCSWGSRASARSPSGCWRAAARRTRRSRPSRGAHDPSSERSGPRWRRSPVSRSPRRRRSSSARSPRSTSRGSRRVRCSVVASSSTRAREQASELSGRLEALGAEVIELPAIEIEDPDDGGAALAPRRGRHPRLRLAGPHVGERRPPSPRGAAATRVTWAA